MTGTRKKLKKKENQRHKEEEEKIKRINYPPKMNM